MKKEKIKLNLSGEQIMASIRDYMRDGATPNDHWGSLHSVPSLFQARHISEADVTALIKEARSQFGELPDNPVYKSLKSQFPEAFK